jgi:hypothetical protein
MIRSPFARRAWFCLIAFAGIAALRFLVWQPAAPPTDREHLTVGYLPVT